MNALTNLNDEIAMLYQYVFNLLQRFKDKIKFFDLREMESYNKNHIHISIHMCTENSDFENINLSQITKEKDISRLRRYCLIIGFNNNYHSPAFHLLDLLSNLKCREIHMLPDLSDFLNKYSFLTDEDNFKRDFPNEIIPNFLFLGSQEHAHNRETLEILGITHILNATRGAANPFSGLKYCRVHVDDSETEKISMYFSKAYEFIDSALIGNLSGKRNIVLVHCAKGVSRSSTLVIMYLMRAVGMCLDEALSFLKKHRDIIEPNGGFMNELREFETNNDEFTKTHWQRRSSVT